MTDSHRCEQLVASHCTGLMSWKHSNDYDPAPVKGSSYREPDYAPSATRHSELQPRTCGTVFRPLSLLPDHSRLSKDNWKLFCSRTHFLSFSFILIVYRVLKAFSLNATLIFTLIIIIIIIIIPILWCQAGCEILELLTLITLLFNNIQRETRLAVTHKE